MADPLRTSRALALPAALVVACGVPTSPEAPGDDVQVDTDKTHDTDEAVVLHRLTMPTSTKVSLGQGVLVEAIAFERATGVEIPVALTWSSDDPSVATVSADGVIHGLRVGSTAVRATSALDTRTTYVRVVDNCGEAPTEPTEPMPLQIAVYDEPNVIEGTLNDDDCFIPGRGFTKIFTLRAHWDNGSPYSLDLTMSAPGNAASMEVFNEQATSLWTATLAPADDDVTLHQVVDPVGDATVWVSAPHVDGDVPFRLEATHGCVLDQGALPLSTLVRGTLDHDDCVLDGRYMQHYRVSVPNQASYRLNVVTSRPIGQAQSFGTPPSMVTPDAQGDTVLVAHYEYLLNLYFDWHPGFTPVIYDVSLQPQ